MSSEWFVRALAGFVPQLPLFAVYIAGIAVSITQLQSRPTKAKLTLFAFVILLLSSLMLIPAAIGPQFFGPMLGGSAARFGVALSVIGFFRSALIAVAFVLLLLAIFGPDRKS